MEWLLFSEFSVVLALVHLFTFFMVVPIFNSMIRIDKSLIEAAYDAGATGLQTLVNVIIPLAKPGIVIGSIFVITIVMGDFITIGVMGGQQIAAAGKIIETRLNALQFPAAAANAVILLVITFLIITMMSRIVDITQGALSNERGTLALASMSSRCSSRPMCCFSTGPMIAIYILSFQGPEGGLTFPMNGVSTYWFAKLFQGTGIVDLGAAFRRSLLLGIVVMAITVVLSVAAGMAFRRKFRAQSILFYSAIASLIVPSIITSLGISLEFRIIDDLIKAHLSDRISRPRWACSPRGSART